MEKCLQKIIDAARSKNMLFSINFYFEQFFYFYNSFNLYQSNPSNCHNITNPPSILKETIIKLHTKKKIIESAIFKKCFEFDFNRDEKKKIDINFIIIQSHFCKKKISNKKKNLVVSVIQRIDKNKKKKFILPGVYC